MAKPSAPEAGVVGVVVGSPPPGPGMPGVATVTPPGVQPAMERGEPAAPLGAREGRRRADARARGGRGRDRTQDYPPALEYLARLEQMKIKQKVNMCVEAAAAAARERAREGPAGLTDSARAPPPQQPAARPSPGAAGSSRRA